MSAIEKQLRGYRLTTAEILYHLPDHPSLLQSYIWQEYDLAPEFPVLHRFLDFWTRLWLQAAVRATSLVRPLYP